MARRSGEGDRRESRSAVTPSRFILDPVLSAAWLYYEEGLKQDEVATQLGISRASVYNLLQKAREEGIISIAIDPSRMELVRIAEEIANSTGLRECFILPAQGHAVPLSERIARLGARLLEQRLSNDSVLGVAWGRTVMSLSKCLSAMSLPGATVAQVTGSSIATYDFSPELCTSNIATRIGGRCINLHAPGIVSSPEMKRLLMKEPVLEQHFRLLRTCTMTLFGVTNVGSQTLLKDSGFMSTEILMEYRRRGAVGFVSGYFFDQEGAPVLTEVDACHIAMPREDFLQVPDRICVGGGHEKIGAIKAMLRGGYANILVTDEETARNLISSGTL